jgi:hypothetical protein
MLAALPKIQKYLAEFDGKHTLESAGQGPSPTTAPAGAAAAEVPPMTPEQAAEFERKAERRFASKIEFTLYNFAGGLMTDDAVLALLAETVCRHEAALRSEIVAGLPLSSHCDAVGMFNIARQVTKRARGLGWHCVNDAAAQFTLRECLDSNLPGLSGRGFLDVRGASFLMADFLYEHREVIVERILKPLTSICEALELAEALVIAEKDSWRGGGAAWQSNDEPRNTELADLALQLFAATQTDIIWSPEDWMGEPAGHGGRNGKHTPMGFTAAGKGGVR